MSVAEHTEPPRHPAKFSKPIIEQIERILTRESPNRPLRIIDPCAGIGGVHVLNAQGGHETVGIELQPEWAHQHPRNCVGDSTSLPWIPSKSFDAMVTSFVYPNRMTDHHNAKDPCKVCDGRGVKTFETYDAELGTTAAGDVRCSNCRGSGLSKRNTYTHTLREVGVEPVESANNATKMKWGPEYRRVHAAIVAEMVRIVDGLLITNISNHLSTVKGELVEHNVVEWFTYQYIGHRCTLVEARRVSTQRNGQGANRDVRVDGEMILVFRTPGAPTWA